MKESPKFLSNQDDYKASDLKSLIDQKKEPPVSPSLKQDLLMNCKSV